MPSLSPSLDKLIDALKRLPGLGPRSASRIAQHLLADEKVQALALAHALEQAVKNIKRCEPVSYTHLTLPTTSLV